MNQSSVIFFFLFAAYFVFITVRGELPIYMGLLLSSAPATPSTPETIHTDNSGTSSDFAATASDIAKTTATVVSVL